MNIQSLSELIPDCRSDKNRRFSADTLVFISLVSVLCGAETWGEIVYFGKSHYEYFKKRIPSLEGIPCEDTFNRFFSVLDTGWFEESFRVWVDEICERIPGVVAIDGKAVCRDKNRRGMKSKLYMVSAWAVANGLCLGQEKVSGKSNEITAIPQLIHTLDLKGCIVTIDAAGCQKSISKAIINAQAEYILCVKDNQKKLRETIAFNLSEDTRLYLGNGKRYTQESRGHGRYELRECVTVDFSGMAECFLPGWAGVRTLAKITCTRQQNAEEPTRQTRYYISSLCNDPKLILQSVRSHWQVENNLHWQLDVSFREDYTRKTGNAAINFSTMSKVALMLLKQFNMKMGIAGKRKACGWDEKLRDEIIGIQFIK
mgnify:CR=1 FL=1